MYDGSNFYIFTCGAVVCMMVPTFIYLLVFVFLIALLYYVFKAVK